MVLGGGGGWMIMRLAELRKANCIESMDAVEFVPPVINQHTGKNMF